MDAIPQTGPVPEERAKGTLGGLLYSRPTNDLSLEKDWVALVRSMATGNKLALRDLCERSYRPVFALIMRITSNRATAADLTVDVFHEAWRRAGNYDSENGTVIGWLMNLARSSAIDQVLFGQRKNRIAPRPDEQPTSESPWEQLAERLAEEIGAPALPSPECWAEPDWQEVAGGISCKLLATDEERDRVSMLVRLAPGIAYPPHRHAGVEELHLLDGELWIGERKLVPGDYNRAEVGTIDTRVWSETGCSCVLITSTRDTLFDPAGPMAFDETTERTSAERRARESEDRFRNMANCAPVLLWMSGRDKLCEFFNHGWLAFTGQSMEHEVGIGWVQGVHPDDVGHCLQIYNSSFDARRPFEMEYRLRRHDGDYRWILDTGAPRFTPDGEFMGYVGSAVDITDKKQAQESSRHLAHLQRLATMGELTAAMAHELRQPLMAIGFNVNSAEIRLDSETPDVHQLKEVLRDIRVDTTRAHQVIGRFRDLVLKREAPGEPLDLNSLVAETLHLLSGEAVRRGVEVGAELHPGITSVIGNRTQLQQVLINLAINGMDAMAATRTRRLIVRTTNGSDNVEVTVIDCGDGIAPEHMPHLFESFFTTKRDGMGLGLFLSRSIVESHRGRIWAENNPGGGATFHFTVPRAADP
jgi:PAS domain S-box-containing protein